MNVIILKTLITGAHERTLTSFGNLDLALINLYGSMRACVGDSNVKLVCAFIIDDNGFIHKTDRYERVTESEGNE